MYLASWVNLLGELPDRLVQVLIGVRVHVRLVAGERIEQGHVTSSVGVDYTWGEIRESV